LRCGRGVGCFGRGADGRSRKPRRDAGRRPRSDHDALGGDDDRESKPTRNVVRVPVLRLPRSASVKPVVSAARRIFRRGASSVGTEADGRRRNQRTVRFLLSGRATRAKWRPWPYGPRLRCWRPAFARARGRARLRSASAERPTGRPRRRRASRAPASAYTREGVRERSRSSSARTSSAAASIRTKTSRRATAILIDSRRRTTLTTEYLDKYGATLRPPRSRKLTR